MQMKVAPGTRVLGIDPGLNTTGYGVIAICPRGPALIEGGVIRGGRGAFGARLDRLYAGLVDVLAEHRPQVMGLEDLFSHYQRPKTAVLMGHARGVLMLAAAKAGVPVTSYLPTKVKLTLTGSGRANKVQMQAAVTRELSLATVPEPHDVADALAIAICHYYLGGGITGEVELADEGDLDADLEGEDAPDDAASADAFAGLPTNPKSVAAAPPRTKRTGVYYRRSG